MSLDPSFATDSLHEETESPGGTTCGNQPSVVSVRTLGGFATDAGYDGYWKAMGGLQATVLGGTRWGDLSGEGSSQATAAVALLNRYLRETGGLSTTPNGNAATDWLKQLGALLMGFGFANAWKGATYTPPSSSSTRIVTEYGAVNSAEKNPPETDPSFVLGTAILRALNRLSDGAAAQENTSTDAYFLAAAVVAQETGISQAVLIDKDALPSGDYFELGSFAGNSSVVTLNFLQEDASSERHHLLPRLLYGDDGGVASFFLGRDPTDIPASFAFPLNWPTANLGNTSLGLVLPDEVREAIDDFGDGLLTAQNIGVPASFLLPNPFLSFFLRPIGTSVLVGLAQAYTLEDYFTDIRVRLTQAAAPDQDLNIVLANAVDIYLDLWDILQDWEVSIDTIDYALAFLFEGGGAYVGEGESDEPTFKYDLLSLQACLRSPDVSGDIASGTAYEEAFGTFDFPPLVNLRREIWDFPYDDFGVIEPTQTEDLSGPQVAWKRVWSPAWQFSLVLELASEMLVSALSMESFLLTASAIAVGDGVVGAAARQAVPEDLRCFNELLRAGSVASVLKGIWRQMVADVFIARQVAAGVDETCLFELFCWMDTEEKRETIDAVLGSVDYSDPSSFTGQYSQADFDAANDLDLLIRFPSLSSLNLGTNGLSVLTQWGQSAILGQLISALTTSSSACDGYTQLSLCERCQLADWIRAQSDSCEFALRNYVLVETDDGGSGGGGGGSPGLPGPSIPDVPLPEFEDWDPDEWHDNGPPFSTEVEL